MSPKSISHYDTTTQEYVEIIYSLLQDNPVARIKEISQQRGVTPSTVSTAIRNLQKQKLVDHQKFGYVDLTREGQELGKRLARRHELLRFFLENVLGVDSEAAEKDACLIEHIITSETSGKLLRFIEFIESFPRGSPYWLEQYRQLALAGHGEIPCQSCPHDTIPEIDSPKE
jgi:DtxR family Mn-dependent transcriptional regulator